MEFKWELVEKRLIEAEKLAEDTFFAKRDALRDTISKQQNKAENLARKLIEKQSPAVTMETGKTPIGMMSADTHTEMTAGEKSAARATAPMPEQIAKTPPRAGKKAEVAHEETAPVAAAPTVRDAETGFATMGIAVGSTTPAANVHGESMRAAEALILKGEKVQAAETGKALFKEMDGIFERHKGIMKKLDLPPPYVEGTTPPGTSSPVPSAGKSPGL